jgi:hypothetical protein
VKSVFLLLAKDRRVKAVYYIGGDGVLDFRKEEELREVARKLRKATRDPFSWKRFQEKPRFAK